MQTIQKLLPQGAGLAPALLRRAATAELDWDTRQRSRFQLRDSAGRDWAVFLPRGRVVRGGDVLVGEDGSLVRIQAAAQPVMVVRACPEHGTPLDLVRAAYHLGNRHVSLAVAEDHLTLEPDHVLADMLRQMHLRVAETQGAFEPEAGAYHAHGTGHDHTGHAAPAGDGHDHAHAHDRDHAHGHGCSHDHGHAHAHKHEH